MTRRQYIERFRRQIYNGQPSADATISVNLVNFWLPDAIAFAAKTNYKENVALEGIEYVNNSFYTVFKGLAISADEQFLWKITLPEIPVGIGENMGVSTCQFKDSDTGQISKSVIWLTENQRTFVDNMRLIPNKILAYQQGEFVYAKSTILLNQYTGNVTMVSGGDSTNLDSTLNVPSDYFPVMQQYLEQKLLLEKAQPVDATIDGLDAIKTT